MNLRWEPTAAGKGGAEWVAAARLMRAIQEPISLAVLQVEQASCGSQLCPHLSCLPPGSASREAESLRCSPFLSPQNVFSEEPWETWIFPSASQQSGQGLVTS